MKVLVCGGAGYIGSNMTALLMAHGHEPVVFDNFCTPAVSMAESRFCVLDRLLR